MPKFKKDYNSKIVLTIISAVLLSTSTLYSLQPSSNVLRPQLGTGDNAILERAKDLYNLVIIQEIIDFILSEEKTKDFYLHGINYGIEIEKYRLTDSEFVLFLAKVMAPFIAKRSRVYNSDLLQYFHLLKAGRNSANPNDISWKEYQYFTRLLRDASRVLSITEGMTTLFRLHNKWNLEKYLDFLISEKHRRGDYSISIKSIGCSKGDQPYSIAFILHQKLEEYNKKIGSPPPAQWDIEIEAFDMNIPNLYATNLGIYQASYAKEKMRKTMTEGDFEKYFERAGESEDLYRVRGFIRDWIRPKYINILDNNHIGILGSKRSEIIFFTNVLIRNQEGFSAPIELEKAISDSFRHDYDHLFVSGNDSTVNGIVLYSQRPCVTSDILEIEIPREWDSSMTRAVARFKPELIKEAIRDALLNKEGGFIQDIILKLGLNGRQIKSIKILPAQEGPYYGVFRGDIMLNTGEVTHFGLNIVLNNSLNEDLEKDYQNLNLLYSLQDKLGLKYVPQTYALGIGGFLDKMGEPVEMRLFAVEWLGGGGFTPEPRSFTELHRDRLINKDKFYLLPNYMQGKLSKSYAPLDNRETIYIRKQIISLLASIFAASFEEGNGGLVIKRTSINNGDFMVRKNKDSSFDICIITARDLGRMSPTEFIDYLLEHEHAEFIEINMPKSGGIAESSVKKFKFYEDRSEIEEGVIDGLAKVYGYEKALHLANTWFKDSGLYDNGSVIAQARQINPTGENPKRIQIDIGQVKAFRENI